MGLLTGKADSKQQYIDVWTDCINSLTSLLAESNIPSSEWDIILQPLRNAVNTAADNLEAEGIWK